MGRRSIIPFGTCNDKFRIRFRHCSPVSPQSMGKVGRVCIRKWRCVIAVSSQAALLVGHSRRVNARICDRQLRRGTLNSTDSTSHSSPNDGLSDQCEPSSDYLRITDWKLLFDRRIEAQPLLGCYEICYKDCCPMRGNPHEYWVW